ncbi:hypothetical protein AC578_10352 [Pseudocercospora eumusae]|uniref:Uncharacterized protein n=1 Tax=Pseudocercospora eumusae TaxID=321146 RepID=A0A139HRC0_9PEZI|nr:hypothetical protein AC578_10352 [Pseudocercospora eumusae]
MNHQIPTWHQSVATTNPAPSLIPSECRQRRLCWVRGARKISGDNFVMPSELSFTCYKQVPICRFMDLLPPFPRLSSTRSLAPGIFRFETPTVPRLNATVEQIVMTTHLRAAQSGKMPTDAGGPSSIANPRAQTMIVRLPIGRRKSLPQPIR